MSQVSGQGTIWNLPNYAGELMTADAEQTPFLSMAGGLSGGQQTSSFLFPLHSAYDYPTAAQPGVTETASLTAATANEAVRTQVYNSTEIHRASINVSYVKMSNQGKLSGLNTQGAVNSVQDEVNWQIAYNLKHIARCVEVSFLEGTYQLATDAGTAAQTRGIVSACSTTDINASSAKLSKSLMNYALRTMYNGGALFDRPVIFCGAFQKQAISDLYGYQPQSVNVGGLNIQTIITDFGNVGVVLDRFITTSVLLIADMAHVAPVFQPVPGKGNFFYEALSKTGASEDGQLFGQIGLNYGAEFLHGNIYGLATS